MWIILNSFWFVHVHANPLIKNVLINVDFKWSGWQYQNEIFIYYNVFIFLWLYLFLLFSLPEPKAQESFSDQNLYILCRHCRKLFTFSSFPEPLCQFQPNLAQSILRCRGFKFVQMKGSALFQGEIITKFWKYIDKFKKSFSPEPLSQFQPNLAQTIFEWGEFKFLNEGTLLFPRRDNSQIVLIHWCFKKSSPPEPLGQFQ